jgi:RNA polymerase sigma factor (sigma-70 family)
MIELAAVQPRDDDRVAELLLAGIPEAHRLASSILRDPIEAEDAVQDALVRAWSRRRNVRFDSGQPHRWFMRIVVNVCRDELRRRRRQPVSPANQRDEPRAEQQADQGANPTAGLDWQTAEYGDLDRAIGRLKEDDQIVLGFRFGRDLTIPQIAAQLSVPEGTIKSRVHYALEHVRAALDADRRAEER